MKLLINTGTTFKGGSIQVAKSFIEECLKYKENEYVIVLSKTLTKAIDTSIFTENFRFYTIPYRPATRVLSIKSPSEFFRKVFNDTQPDVVFTTSGPAYWTPTVPHVVGYNLGHYIYPESPFFQLISTYRKLRFKFREWIVFHYFRRNSNTFVVQTDDVNRRLQKKLKNAEIITVSNTCSSVYFDSKRFPDKLGVKSKEEFRYLTLSAYYIHKGFHIMISVIRYLIANGIDFIKFITTIKTTDFNKYIPSDVKSHIINVGPVKIEECPSLYNECDAMFLPTLLECFSASYVEAMAMKKPIITTDLSFAHTVCGDAALYFDPYNTIQAAQKIIELANDKDLQSEMIEKLQSRLNIFYGPEERAKRYLAICKSQIDV